MQRGKLVDLNLSFEKQAGFYARYFRAPAVADKAALERYRGQLDGDAVGSDPAVVVITREVEAAAARLEGRTETVILATSIVLSAAVVLLSTGNGMRWLELVATLCSAISLYLSLFAHLVYAGRPVLGMVPAAQDPTDAYLGTLARRLSTKAALSAHGVALLYPASIALVISALA